MFVYILCTNKTFDRSSLNEISLFLSQKNLLFSIAVTCSEDLYPEDSEAGRGRWRSSKSVGALGLCSMDPGVKKSHQQRIESLSQL